MGALGLPYDEISKFDFRKRDFFREEVERNINFTEMNYYATLRTFYVGKSPFPVRKNEEILYSSYHAQVANRNCEPYDDEVFSSSIDDSFISRIAKTTTHE